MNPNEQHEAFKHLHSQAVADEKLIDSASPQEIDALLTADGVDLAKLNARIADKKKLFAGKYALLLARQRRLASVPSSIAPLIPATKEEILARLREKYGESLPLAAQRCREMDYGELSLLYADLEGKPRADGK
jgi:hypothetical protein